MLPSKLLRKDLLGLETVLMELGLVFFLSC